ncbi:MAG: EAL domain-containing protein [Phormidesmis sp.]
MKRVDGLRMIRFGLMGIVYLLAALLGIVLTREGGSVAALWPPNAILLGVLLRTAPSNWLGYIGICLFANALANLLMGDSVAVALGFVACNAIEILTFVAVVWRFMPLPIVLKNTAHPLTLVSAGVVSAAAGATAGAGLLNAVYAMPYRAVWLTWWIASVMGFAIIMPVALSASGSAVKQLFCGKQRLEIIICGLSVIATTVVVFLQSSYTQSSHTLLYLLVPLLLWGSYRFGVFACSVLSVSVAVLAIAFTLHGIGPLDHDSGNFAFDSIQSLQLYLGTVLLPPLMLGIEHDKQLLIEAELGHSRARYRQLYEEAPVMMHCIDPQGRLLSVSTYWLDVMGYKHDEVIGRYYVEFLTEPSRRYALATAIPKYVHTGLCRNAPYQMVKKSGEIMDTQVSTTAERNDRGDIVRSLSVILDVTARKRAEASLIAEKERAQVTLKSIGDAVITTDAEGYINYLNPVAETLTGWSYEAAQGQPLLTVFRIINECNREPAINPVTRCLAEGRIVGLANHTILVNRDGQEYAIEDSAAPIQDAYNQVLGAVLVFHDVSEQRRLQQEMTHQAQHDALTGLVNRSEFERRLQRVIETAQQHASEHALCYLDLDQFKVVNDTCGHAAGDALLQQLSVLFESKIRDRDTLARLGGDEFGVLLEHCSLASAQSVANTLRQATEDFRFSWQDQCFRVGVSIGLVPVDATSHSVDNVLQAADSACYVAKDAGRNRVHVYLDDDEVLVHRYGQMQWISRIQRALEEDRFELYAQPIVALNDPPEKGAHYEFLIRLAEEDGRVSLPGAFMPAAERYNLAVAIDRWVVSHAFRWLADHPAVLDDLGLFTLNLSGHSIGDRSFHAYVLHQLDETELPAEKICFEITETAAVANLTEATRFMLALKIRGCCFSLDDFGSGLSSFGYLKALPVDFLKIDGLFVKDIVEDPVDLAMVRSINEIAQLLNKQTVAEYVENDDILAQLRMLGVDYGQGYGLGKPQPLSILFSQSLNLVSRSI